MYVQKITPDVKYKLTKFAGNRKYTITGLATQNGTLICDMVFSDSIISNVNILITNHSPQITLKFNLSDVKKAVEDELFMLENVLATAHNIALFYDFHENNVSIQLYNFLEQYAELPSLLEYESIARFVKDFFKFNDTLTK